ncbi:hypothetical protein PGT21_017566 [Puccinia graminis f. sp. tritici]|uniref:Uncharacterized protein n=1 Tax=Puccinia graminis f. sp. tritici TaxID=56615 RepID=A0A5B0NMP9_PUCGR|nr:hypothetical protein PGT21_017566 [Puccinia graminis f. sp. tritici]
MKNLYIFCLLIIPLLAYFVSASLSPKIGLVGKHSCDEQMPGVFKNLKDHSTELEGIRTRQPLPLLQTSFDAPLDEAEISRTWSFQRQPTDVNTCGLRAPDVALKINDSSQKSALPNTATLADISRGAKRLAVGIPGQEGEGKGAAYQPAPKKVKFDLNLSLGPPGVEKEEASPTRSSYNCKCTYSCF